MSTDVKVFRSSDTGAPELAGVTDALISLLDACLLNGYNEITLDSLTVSGGVATATYGAGHGFAMIGNVGAGLVQVGPVIAIAGATPSGLNAEHRITVVDSSTFTFATGEGDTTASGTITAKMAPLGWTKTYSGTSKAAYQGASPAASGLYLRVDDSDARYPAMRGYETMSDIDTGTRDFPLISSNPNHNWAKSNSANSDPRDWILIGDGVFFYFLPRWHSSYTHAIIYYAGDIVSYVPSDAYPFVLPAHNDASPSNLVDQYDANDLLSTGGNGLWLARNIAQTTSGSPVVYVQAGSDLCNYWGASGLSTISAATGHLFYHHPVLLREGDDLRGTLPGAVQPVQTDPGTHENVYATPLGALYLLSVVGTLTQVTGKMGLIIDEAWR